MKTLCIVAIAILAGCGGAQPAIGAPGAATTQASAIATHTGSVQPVSCPSQYIECITLTYGSPFEQEWCLLPPAGLRAGMGFTKAGCKNFLKSGTWSWKAKIFTVSSPRRHFWRMNVSFDPNPGNPTELTLTEKRRLSSSSGQIVYEARLDACSPFSGGIYCPEGHSIGIATGN